MLKRRSLRLKTSWKGIVETKRSVGEEAGSSSKPHSQSSLKRSWRNAVLVTRLSAFNPWSRIQSGLSRMLKSHQVLSPVAADRAVLWSNSDDDKSTLEKMGLCSISEAGTVYFQRWKPDSQFKNLKTVCTNSWIGIEGLPINCWNVQVFKDIGQRCGGLLDIARCTLDLSFLSFASILLRGNKGGFIPEFMEIDWQGIKVKIKLVSFRERNLSFLGVLNLQRKGSKVEDEVDVAARSKKTTWERVINPDFLTDLSDKDRMVPQSSVPDGRKFPHSAALSDDYAAQSTKGKSLVEPASSALMKKTHAEKTAQALKIPSILVKNRFRLLQDMESTNLPVILSPQTVSLGQAHVVSENRSIKLLAQEQNLMGDLELSVLG